MAHAELHPFMGPEPSLPIPPPPNGSSMKPEWENAAKAGDVSALASQLAAGADIDSLDKFGQSALMLTAQRGHLEAVKLLTRRGADLNITAKFSLSAVMLAVVNHHEQTALTIASAGADLSLVGSGAPGFAGKNAAQLAFDQNLRALSSSLQPRGQAAQEDEM